MQQSIVFISLAFFALTSATDVVPTSDVKTANVKSVVTNAVPGLLVGGELSPLIASLQGPLLRTVNADFDGTLINYGHQVGSTVVPINAGLQGPFARTVSIGPDGGIIDNFANGGFVSQDGSVLVAPSSYAAYGRAVNQILVHPFVPSVIPQVRSVVYTPVYHPEVVQIPTAKSVVAGPSGTIVAK